VILTTHPQRVSIKRKHEQLVSTFVERIERGECPALPPTYREFRATVQPTFGCDGAVVVKWCGMWVCIERDGYAHT
jgi:hypothetical protein